jgi:3D (Asp-Asp-Asp) domain-containing protein
MGYWVVSHDGDVYSFGGAHFYGSLGKTSLPGEVVGIAPTPSGHGYWLVTARGGVYSFGNARFFGSLGRSSIASPVVGIAPSPHAAGYWLATAGGGVFSFGGARFFGNGTKLHLGAVVTAVASPPSSEGYWLLSAKGRVYPFGQAPRFGSVNTRSGAEASSIAATPSGRGLLVTTDAATLQSSLATRAKAVSRQGAEQSPASGPLRYLGTFMVTCYDLTGPTATGALAGPQSVAVDPSVIALGTRIYVQGLGVRTADDTGGAIIGNHIDIWEPAYSTCANWGVQERAVYAVVGY